MSYAIDRVAVERSDQIRVHGYMRADDRGRADELMQKAADKLKRAFDIFMSVDDDDLVEKFLIEASALCAAASDALEKNHA